MNLLNHKGIKNVDPLQWLYFDDSSALSPASVCTWNMIKTAVYDAVNQMSRIVHKE